MKFIILGAALLAMCTVLFLYFLQDSLIYFPRSYGPEYRYLRVKVEEIHYSNRQGDGLAFYYGPKNPARLWVLFGGNAMLALDWIGWLQDYSKENTGFLLIDYPAYGESEGKPSPQAIQRASMAAYEELSIRWDGNNRPSLHLLGISLGASVALNFATQHPPEALVLLAPFTSLKDMACQSVGKPLCYLLRHDYDNRQMLKEVLRHKPKTLMLHGDRDQVIPKAMGEELAAAHEGELEFYLIRGAGHNDLLDQEKRRIYQFMESIKLGLGESQHLFD